MQSDLLCLKNLGATTVHWLHMIGVNNSEELQKLGAIEAYLRIKRRGMKVSRVTLYALHGALTDNCWTSLDAGQKKRLERAVEQADRAVQSA